MIVLVGCNHRSAPVSLREQLAFADAELPEVLRRLVAREGIAAAMLLCTCNRVEVLARATTSARRAQEEIGAFLCAERGLTAEQLDHHSYRFAARDAVEHLFGVAAGLNSQILGEPQILGQVKHAYRLAQRAGTLDPVLERVLQQALASAKRVRSRTGIDRHPVTVACAAVQLARQIFGELPGRRVLVLGAGKMAELVARQLTAAGPVELIVTSRTYNHARLAAERVGGRPVHWDEGLARLGQVDIVVACTGAMRPVLTRPQVAAALRARRGHPLLVIDIAVPRDVDPAVNELDNVYLYDIDGLQDVVDANLSQRRAAAEQARQEIAADVLAFDRWRQSLEVTPTIVALRERLLGLGLAEIERFRRRLGPLSAEQQEGIAELTRALVHKILHRPTVHLRRSVERGEAEACASSYREIFGLDEPQRAAGGGSREGDDPAAGPRHVIRGGKDA
jgi:glutamyl-tRNA reductase